MKRLLTCLILLCFSACLPATSAGPNEQSDAPSPRTEARANTQDDTDVQPSTRFARPPAGTAPTWQADPETQAYNDAPRREAPPTRPTQGPTPTQADKSRRAPSTADVGSSSAAPAEGRAKSSTGGDAYMAQPTKKDSARSAVAEDERPGLGTSWGETRSSSVYEAPFERDSSSPSYTTALSYNDRHGASALAGGSSYSTNASVGLSSALTISLRDNYGNVLPAYRGNGRTVAVGENGQRYTIVVQNNTNERFEVVLSVDGLDVLDGEEASYNKRGYLIDAYGTLEIEGFRQSQDAVAAFRFGSVSDSYAARTGSARNVGVIGAAAFGERGYAYRLRAYQERLAAQRYSSREIDRRRNADPFPAKWAEPPRETMTIAR